MGALWAVLIVVLGTVACSEDPPPAPAVEEVSEGERYARQRRAEMSELLSTFAGHVREGRPAEAYAMTAAGYRQTVDEATFTAGLARVPYLSGITSVDPNSVGSTQRGGSLVVRCTAHSGSDIAVVMNLTQEDGAWKITGLTLGGMQALPTPGG